MARWIKSIMCLALAMALGLSAQPQVGESSSWPQIAGTVFDPSGAVIVGAFVQALDARGLALQSVRTGKNGFFLLAGLAAGDVRLLVSSSGFQPKEIPLRIEKHATLAPLCVTLDLPAVSATLLVRESADGPLGLADSSAQGTVSAQELAARPLLRAGEILEAVPGLILTQHAGGGKANQYYLRGFNLDHGVDFAIFVDGMPLNLPSHAHGEGYSDMNIVIPEFVKRIDFAKGPYSANVGDYGSAGSAHIEFFHSLPENFVRVEGGAYRYGRVVFGLSRPAGSGELLCGGELSYDDGPWAHPDAYSKANGLLTYSRGQEANGFTVTARGYHGRWRSSDQLPQNAIALVGLYGSLDSSNGGRSQRYSLQSDWRRQSVRSIAHLSAYGFYYDLDLFSNFTYYLIDPVRGDQFEQQDRRWVAGFEASYASFRPWAGRKSSNTVGLQLRNDWIANGLYATRSRLRMDKYDYAAAAPLPPLLPATRSRDRFMDTLGGVYLENKIQWSAKFRSLLALRGDLQRFDVHSLAYSQAVNAANSGLAIKFLPSPKLGLVFGPWAKAEFYAQGGFSFHSNDGRGATQTIEPISAEYPYPNTPAARIPPLVQTKGAEIGLRFVAISHLQSVVSLWGLHSNSELMQDGDTGGTSASEQSSHRYGVEWANDYTPSKHLAIDLDFADSRALFTVVDADDAAPNSPGGRRVPEAVGAVISSGVALRDWRGLSSSLRLRYFGPRDLTSDGLYRSNPTVLLNGALSLQVALHWRIAAEFLNLLNRNDSDIDYAYVARITPGVTPEGAPLGPSSFTRVSHPVEPFQMRFALTRSF